MTVIPLVAVPGDSNLSDATECVNTVGQQSQYNIWVGLLEQMMFQLAQKGRQRINQNDVVRQAVPEAGAVA